MASGLNRGEIWLYTFKAPDKRRPVLILSRQRTLPFLQTVIAAPITSTIRGLPSEVVIGVEEGLKRDSAVNLDNIQSVHKGRLKHYLGSVGDEKLAEVCRALAVATGCY